MDIYVPSTAQVHLRKKKKKSHLDSYSKPGRNAKHQNTNEKLTASTTHLTNPREINSAVPV